MRQTTKQKNEKQVHGPTATAVAAAEESERISLWPLALALTVGTESTAYTVRV